MTLRRPGSVLALWALLCAALLLQGCASAPQFLELGTERTVVEQRLGTPTQVHPLPNGTRLQYSGQPMGTEVYNIDLDAQGRVAKITQALVPGHFLQALQVGVTTEPDVFRELGAPALVERVARFDGDIWTYRYRDFGTNWFLHVHLDPQRVVRQIITLEESPGPFDLGTFH